MIVSSTSTRTSVSSENSKAGRVYLFLGPKAMVTQAHSLMISLSQQSESPPPLPPVTVRPFLMPGRPSSASLRSMRSVVADTFVVVSQRPVASLSIEIEKLPPR